MGRFTGIFGYSDDNWLIAPSLPALQDMLVTCQEFAARHNLKFSTDLDPKKCKTKCMAFLHRQRELPSLLEPVSGEQHMSITLIRNFLNFINMIKRSSKPILRHLYSIVKSDVRTTTGSNLRADNLKKLLVWMKIHGLTQNS